MDKLLMENYLLVLKSTVEVFVHGTLESSNEDIRTTLKSGLDRTSFLMCKLYCFQKNKWQKRCITLLIDKLFC